MSNIFDRHSFYSNDENFIDVPCSIRRLKEFSFWDPNESYERRVDEIGTRCQLVRHDIWQATSQIYQVLHDWGPLRDPALLESALCFASGNIRDL